MIIIVTSSNDLSIIDIGDWIKFYKNKYQIINENSKIELHKIDLCKGEVVILIDGYKINLDSIESIWYRKIHFKTDINQLKECKNESIQFRINEYMKLENDVLTEFINHIFEKTKKVICSNDKLYVNKLIQLQKAKDAGLNIPKTWIFTNKSDLEKHKNKSFITKGIFEAFLYNDLEHSCSSGTELVNYNSLVDIDNSSFAPSLFQENIEKLFEIRIFYFKEEFYSMAIFSQSNEKTQIDFRNYDYEKANRMVPYKLPITIKEKLNKFMKDINLDTGSIDLILTPKYEYYFLEVNPVGQFGFLSGLCNYNIEKRIAKYLCNYE